MKAAIYTGPGQAFAIRDVPVPRTSRGGLLVRVRRSGVCGSDLVSLADPVGRGLTPGQTILGHEFAGEVAEIGPGVTRFKVGDRVTSMAFVGCDECESCRRGAAAWCPERRSLRGAYAQYALTSENSCWHLPVDVAFDIGALCEPIAVAVHAVTLAGPLDGKRVLVIGAGTIGQLVARFANDGGAIRVIVTARSRQREAGVVAIGHSRFLRVDELATSLTDSMSGTPDVIFDCAGGSDTLQLAARLIGARGRIVAAAGHANEVAITPLAMLRKEIRLSFAVAYQSADFDQAVEIIDRDSSAFSALIAKTVNWDSFPDAVLHAFAGEGTGKLQLNPL